MSLSLISVLLNCKDMARQELLPYLELSEIVKLSLCNREISKIIDCNKGGPKVCRILSEIISNDPKHSHIYTFLVKEKLFTDHEFIELKDFGVFVKMRNYLVDLQSIFDSLPRDKNLH